MLLCVGEFFNAEYDSEWQAVQKQEIAGKRRRASFLVSSLSRVFGVYVIHCSLAECCIGQELPCLQRKLEQL